MQQVITVKYDITNTFVIFVTNNMKFSIPETIWREDYWFIFKDTCF